eukprot:6178104-Pleurochrysis_carterae.AAC.1
MASLASMPAWRHFLSHPPCPGATGRGEVAALPHSRVARYTKACDSMLAALESHTFEVPTCMPEECSAAGRQPNLVPPVVSSPFSQRGACWYPMRQTTGLGSKLALDKRSTCGSISTTKPLLTGSTLVRLTSEFLIKLASTKGFDAEKKRS